ncbi:MAG: metallophosphoesterase [Acetatifactor sp.]|nr:metallophosphoesterase [Acetatifactor sp.]
MIILSVILTVLVIWTVWCNVTVGVTHYTVVSNRLPVAFDHYKIAVISDLHNAEFGENNSSLISLIKNEKPDMIAITGDLIDSNRTDIEIAENLVKKLVEIAPCYYVTGNHEAWIGEQYQDLEDKLLDIGVVIFHDNTEQLVKNNEIIQLAGLDDPDFTDRNSSIQESMLKTKLDNMNLTENYCVLLSHRPEVFNAYVSENIDLVLSGHAHGGQFRLPFIGGLIAPNQGFFPKYDAGEYFEKNTTMIVSRGIGNSIIPIRFNNRPEVVIVELTCNK